MCELFFHRNEIRWMTNLLFGLLIVGGGKTGNAANPITSPEVSETICKYLDYMDKCLRDLDVQAKLHNVTEETHCIGEFDGFACWPHTEVGTMNSMPCPGHLSNEDNRYAHRHCLGNAYTTANEIASTIDWRNTDECVMPVDNTTEHELDEKLSLLVNVRTMYTVGHAVSVTFLVVAILFLSVFKKLHCTRNYIHMTFMVSFLLKYVLIFIRDGVLDSLGEEIFTENAVDTEKLRQFCNGKNDLTGCRIVITLVHYLITVNFFWLLVEGMYLQLTLMINVNEDRHFVKFMSIGWGGPLVPVVIWVALRINLENYACWERNEDLRVWWVIRAPLTASITVNFALFANIVRIIITKLRGNIITRADKALSHAKPTLSLIALFGIHHMIYLTMTEDEDTVYKKLAFLMFINSIQGALISILYCFLNNEVRGEIRRSWKQWRKHRGCVRTRSSFESALDCEGSLLSTGDSECQRNSADVDNKLVLTPIDGTGTDLV